MLSARLGGLQTRAPAAQRSAHRMAHCARPALAQRAALTNRTPLSGASPLFRPSSRVLRAPPCQAVIEKMDAKELEVAIAERDRPLIIDFYATWCGPCVLLAQELEKLAKEVGDKVRIVKVDVDQNPSLSNQLQIQGLPTMVFVDVKSKPALRTEGLLPLDTIKEILRNEMQVQI